MCAAYTNQKPVKSGLPLSQYQHTMLEGLLHMGKPKKVGAGTQKTRFGVPFDEDVYKQFLHTPILNSMVEGIPELHEQA